MAVDESASGRLAARLVGLLVGARGMPTTVVPLKHTGTQASHSGGAGAAVTVAAKQGHAATPNDSDSPRSPISIEVVNPARSLTAQDMIATEADKGFGLVWVGVEPAVDSAGAIHPDVTGAIAGFNGNSAIVFARDVLAAEVTGRPPRLLLAVTGTAYSSRAADIALALAQASAGTLTALYVDPEAAIRGWHQDLGGTLRSRRHGAAVLREVLEVGVR